ncbi:MAG: hypothetical protein AABO58_14530 [Acidobacteriota bacterium]
MRRLVPLLLILATSLHAQTREELLRSPKTSEAKAPRFETLTADALRAAIKVYSRRNYAAFGFNDSSVTVRLPAAANSIYAAFEFDEPKLTDARGRAVAYEVEQGIFDFDTWSNEIRLKPKDGRGIVDFAHAVGKATVKYPLVVKTTSIKKGSDKRVTIDGPYVSYSKSAMELPEPADFSKVEALRAYDAAGHQLERADATESFMVGDATWRKLGFWGKVAEVRVDRVEKWATVTIDYDLPPSPKLPESAQGLTPPLEERLKATEPPGARVTKTIQ